MKENKKEFIKKSNKYIIIMLLTIIGIVAVGTYALLVWNSGENTELTIRIGSLSGCVGSKGPDINISNLGPIFNYEQDGEYTTFNVTNFTNASSEVHIMLNITSISGNLRRPDFKYAVMSSTDGTNYTFVSGGDFSDARDSSSMVLADAASITANGSVTYKVIFYIDGNMENPISMQGSSLIGTISVTACTNATPAADTIMALASTDACAANGVGVCPTNSYTSSGTTKYHDYRYRGGEGVNNFVWFNDDMYRIIGVFDENSHGVTGEYLVKLISANILTRTSWGAYNDTATSGTYYTYTNDWTGNTTGVKTNLNILLNEFFYTKKSASSTYGACANWTYGYSNNLFKTNDCTNIISYGIDSSLQNYIQESTWYLKGYISEGFSKQDFYTCERSEDTTITSCASGNSGAYDTSTTENIGLMYASDYLYASSYYASDSTQVASNGYHLNQNWLYQGDEWTITTDGNHKGNAFYVAFDGLLTISGTREGYGVRPAFYLTASVYIIGGDGSFSNPYRLSL